MPIVMLFSFNFKHVPSDLCIYMFSCFRFTTLGCVCVCVSVFCSSPFSDGICIVAEGD